VTSPDGERRLETFSLLPWPSWRYRLEDGTEVEQQLFAVHGSPRVVLSWKLTRPAPGVRLVVRPFLSGRDYHALHHENPAFRFDARQEGDSVRWHPYDGVPEVMVRSNGAYTREPLWYRGFLYAEERDRGLDCVEDLASPGSFTWNLSAGEALWSLEAASGVAADGRPELSTEIARLRAAERARRDGTSSRPTSTSPPRTRRTDRWRSRSAARWTTPCSGSSPATPTGLATAFTQTATACSPRASPACSSRGWMQRSATGS